MLRNELKPISANEAMTWKGVDLSDEQHTMPLPNDLPSFKNQKLTDFVAFSNLDADFPGNTDIKAIEPSKNKVTATRSEVENSNNVATYLYAQNYAAVTYTSGIQNVSNYTYTIQNSKRYSTNNSEIQSLEIFSNSNSFSNTSSNAFFANNTLSITTDLSDNNSPMLIDGDSNPGDPGVPVGDGVWVLLMMLLVYGLFFCK